MLHHLSGSRAINTCIQCGLTMRISEILWPLAHAIAIGANTLVFLDLPPHGGYGPAGQLVNDFFYNLDDWCFHASTGLNDASSSGVFFLNLQSFKPTALGVLHMATDVSVPSYVVRSHWNLIAPNMGTSVLSGVTTLGLPDDLVISAVEKFNVDAAHFFNRPTPEFMSA